MGTCVTTAHIFNRQQRLPFALSKRESSRTGKIVHKFQISGFLARSLALLDTTCSQAICLEMPKTTTAEMVHTDKSISLYRCEYFKF